MGNARTILIVDDERQIRRFLRTGLSMQGFEVLEAESGAEALSIVPARQPDLVVLDLQLGDMDGLDVLRRIREWSWLPVLILTVRSREVEKVKAFEAGADDYITKPFGIAECIARVNALLRRIPEVAAQPVFAVGDLSIDMARRQVYIDGSVVKLSPKEYALLQFLARHAGRVVTHEQMLGELWGADHAEDAHYLRIFMRRLRQKVERNPTQPRYLITELGVGYRLRVQDQLEPIA